MEEKYIAGQCNLGKVETRRRYRIGYFGIIVTIVFILIIEIASLPEISRFLIIAPVFYSLSGFIQAKHKFCYIYGYKHLSSIAGRKVFKRVHDVEAQEQDKKLANKIVIQSLSGSLVAGLIYYVLPV
jgi:hypothetical protein